MFVHLRLHTEFSVVDGTTRVDDVVASAARDRQPALAITDFGNLFGAIKFYKAARGAGVKPLIGAEVLLEGREAEQDAPIRVLLLVVNHQGYLNLSELLARAWTQGVVKAQAVVRWDWLAELADPVASADPVDSADELADSVVLGSGSGAGSLVPTLVTVATGATSCLRAIAVGLPSLPLVVTIR